MMKMNKPTITDSLIPISFRKSGRIYAVYSGNLTGNGQAYSPAASGRRRDGAFEVNVDDSLLGLE